MNDRQDTLDILPAKAFFSIVNGEIRVWNAFQDALQAVEVPVGVGRLIPLFYLVDGPMRLQDLTERTRAKQSAASRLVERMVKDGLIVKERDGGDGRAVVLRVTPEGRRVEAAGRAVFEECLSGLFGDLDDADLRTLCALLARVGSRGEEARA